VGVGYGRIGAMRIYVSSLGCKLNQAEMDALAAQLAREGHQVVASPAGADLSILNTCAVTHVAAQKSRQALRRLHRDNPQARLVATGCYAELSPGELESLPGVERVVGNAGKAELATLLGLADMGRRLPVDGFPPASSAAMPRTRALVKIQDGCDNACTYCIIHVARGPQRSRPADEVVGEVRARLAAGHHEIVLTGVHVGAYGHDRQGGSGATPDLWGLVRRILDETDVPRLRLSSIEPWDLVPGPVAAQTLALWQDPRLCRHLHLPLQSGSDATLARMGRRYTAARFAELVEAARAAIPDLAVTSDVIVGFPGETEADFAQSLDLVREMGLARVHVFPYSPRPGTPAARMPGQVPAQVRAERARHMREVAAEGGRAFRRRFVGRRVEVLWESSRPGDGVAVWSGLTDHYLRVEAADPTGRDLGNTFGQVHIESLSRGGLRGEMQGSRGQAASWTGTAEPMASTGSITPKRRSMAMVWLQTPRLAKKLQVHCQRPSRYSTLCSELVPSKETWNSSNRMRSGSSAYRLDFWILPIMPESMCTSSSVILCLFPKTGKVGMCALSSDQGN